MSADVTGAGTHRATAPGYAGNAIIEIGGEVPPGIPVGSWMVEARAPEPVAPAVPAVSPFDHDGRPGGSLPGRRRRKHK